MTDSMRRAMWRVLGCAAAISSAGLAAGQPANDECSNAQAVIETLAVASSTTDATGAAVAPCSGQAEDVWYSLPAPSGSTYAVDFVNPSVSMTVAVYDSCGGSLISDINGRPACRLVDPGGSATILFGGNGDQVLIRVASDAPGGGTFELTATSDAPTGACCEDGVCAIRTEGACAALAGSYLGDGSECTGGGPAGAPQTFGPNFPNAPIGPGAGTVTEDTINIAGGPESVGDVTVTLDLQHFFLADLRIELEHVASGTIVSLFENGCGENDDLRATFSDTGDELSCATPTEGTFVPQAPMAGFDGLDPNGDWTLRITDDFNFEDGVLSSWSLSVDGISEGPCANLSCPCEFGGDGGSIDVQDLLGFLALWFESDAGADINGGGVDVTDLLDFLECWFPASSGAGCP